MTNSDKMSGPTQEQLDEFVRQNTIHPTVAAFHEAAIELMRSINDDKISRRDAEAVLVDTRDVTKLIEYMYPKQHVHGVICTYDNCNEPL